MSKSPEPYVRLPSTEKTSPQNIWLWRPAGLTFRTARLLWERNSTPKRAHKISYALGPRVRAVIWKEPGSDELAALESLLERLRGN